MPANTLISEIRNKGYSIRADGDFIDIFPADLPSKLINQLKQEKTEILAELKREVEINDNYLYGYTMQDLKEVAADDWQWMIVDPAFLEAFAYACASLEELKTGKTPKHYTATTNCKNCGEVPVPPSLVNNGFVMGCMWCPTRTKH